MRASSHLLRSVVIGWIVLRQNSVRRQVIDLSALIQRRSPLNGHSPALPAFRLLPSSAAATVRSPWRTWPCARLAPLPVICSLRTHIDVMRTSATRRFEARLRFRVSIGAPQVRFRQQPSGHYVFCTIHFGGRPWLLIKETMLWITMIESVIAANVYALRHGSERLATKR